MILGRAKVLKIDRGSSSICFTGALVRLVVGVRRMDSTEYYVVVM